MAGESNGPVDRTPPESTLDQDVEASDVTQIHRDERQTAPEKNRFMPPIKRPEGRPSGRPEFRWVDNQIWLDGRVIRSRADADSVIKFIEALRPMLKEVKELEPKANSEPDVTEIPLIATTKDDPQGF